MEFVVEAMMVMIVVVEAIGTAVSVMADLPCGVRDLGANPKLMRG
jgi:hypothetical protein